MMGRLLAAAAAATAIVAAIIVAKQEKDDEQDPGAVTVAKKSLLMHISCRLLSLVASHTMWLPRQLVTAYIRCWDGAASGWEKGMGIAIIVWTSPKAFRLEFREHSRPYPPRGANRRRFSARSDRAGGVSVRGGRGGIIPANRLSYFGNESIKEEFDFDFLLIFKVYLAI